MIGLAINLLWLLIGVIVICGVVWVLLYGLKNIAGVPIPPRIEQGIWFIIFLLVLIGALTLLTGGGSGLKAPSFW
jgi:hypothetical protein